MNDENIELARIAIRERSPTYANNKLISTYGPVATELNITVKDKEKASADVNMHIL